MNLIRNLSIRAKIILIVQIVSLLTIAGGTAADVFFEIRGLRQTIKDYALYNTRLIARHVALPLEFDYADKGYKVLSNLSTIKTICNARVYKSNGELFAGFCADNDCAVVPWDTASFAENTLLLNDHVHTFVPVEYQGKAYGVAYTKVSTGVNHLIRQRLLTALLSAVVMFALSFVMAGLLQRIVTQPLYRLAKTVTQVSATNDYSIRAIGAPADEVGILYRKFNYMLEVIEIRIEERDRALKELNEYKEDLEQLVEERTTEIRHQSRKLTLANTRLEREKTKAETALANLRQMQSQLVQSEKMASLGVLTAGIAHEINNPVNFISGGLEGIKVVVADLNAMLANCNTTNGNSQGVQLTDDRGEMQGFEFYRNALERLTKSMEVGVKRTTEIVRSLRVFSHSDESMMSQANVHSIIDAALTLLQNQYKNRIEIERNYCPNGTISCLAGPLNQVFLNILSNAIQAIEGQGHIYINTHEEANYLCIELRDTGMGLPGNVVQKIFEPFFTTKEVGKGTGLGLSISYSIVQKHKGSIQAHNHPNGGAVFTIRLPRQTV